MKQKILERNSVGFFYKNGAMFATLPPGPNYELVKYVKTPTVYTNSNFRIIYMMTPTTQFYKDFFSPV